MNNIYTKRSLVLSLFNKYRFCSLKFVNNYSVHHTEDEITRSVNEALKKPMKDLGKPVDWLPFQWTGKPGDNHYVDSGDLVKYLEYDPTWPKPNFELSEELKTANDDIKYKFSLATASKGEIKEVVRRKTLERIQRHPNDFDSLEVKIALKTLQIRSLFEHCMVSPEDVRGSRVALEIIIKKRNKLLKHLMRMDTERFNWLCEELKLYYKPQRLGGEPILLTKKSLLRKETKEYCKKLVEDKKIAYHEELKKQQEEFLKEKAEILAWIEKEEKELANLTIS